MKIYDLWRSFSTEFADRLRQAEYLLADTRIPWVSLYDHLVLTGGIAAAFTEELLRRGKAPEEICGLSLNPSELRHLACLCGLLHDLGKAREGETDYRLHVRRGVEYVQEWLTSKGVDDPLKKIILGAVARHHLRDGPETLFEELVCLADSYASAGDRPELGRAATLQEFAKLIRETKQLEQKLFEGQPPLCLLMGDANAIKSYVYETQALPDIRGASQILVELEEEVRQLFRDKLVEECLIYCGGGGFLAIVPASMAEELKQGIERLYLERTQIATVTVVSSEPLGYVEFARGLAPYTDDQVRSLSAQGVAGDLLFSHFEALLIDRTKRKNFGELVSALTGKLQQAKRQREGAPFFETLPVYRRCDSCGKRAAETWDNVRAEWICRVCNQKRQKGRQERRDFMKAFEEWTRQERDFEGKFRFAEDLDTLAGSDGKIALLYADGNNMGELLQLMPSPASYRHFSNVLESATKDALFAAVWTVFGEESLKSANSLPFEIIALGGDDVVVIVPAEYGWALALQMLKEFEHHAGIQKLAQELSERLGEGALRRLVSLTLSAGLAIADVKYPVSFLFALAEGLLKEAKRLARERRTSTLCHLWLRAPVISERADVVLDALYKRDFRNSSAVLTARPYTRENAERLTHLAQMLAGLPATQRRTLAEALEKGVHVSLNYALYQADRRKEQQTELRQVFEELGGLLGSGVDGLWFWRNVPQEGWKTTLLDALELIELGAEKHYPAGGANGTSPAD